jgi:alpha-beta hydrolase superfamily lysophospholipase
VDEAAAGGGLAREEWEVESAGGVKIHCRRFSAPGAARAGGRGLIAIVPGFSDHGERYARLVPLILADGFSAAALDTRGHGRSGGVRGHITRFEEYLLDVDAFLLSLRRGAPEPVFLFGHSMGGLIVLAYLSAGYGAGTGLRGAIVQAPWLKLTAAVPRWKSGLARALSRIAPRVPFASPVRREDLSRDLAVGDSYLKDPLVHQTCSPRLFTEVTATAARIFANPVDYRVPTLFTHGEDDPIMDPAGTRSYFERSPLAEKALAVFPGARHEVHNDPAVPDLWREMRAFMEARLATAARA